MMELSKRLQMVADMVEQGSTVADVGCDHGYVAIYLVRQGICPHVYAMDINEGPLERAAEHVREAGLSSRITLRLSDGLKALGWRMLPDERPEEGLPDKRLPEADTLLMAGLGGRLASRILEESADKLKRMRRVVVSPQSELWLVRRTLRKLGYLITDENMIVEEGKFYTAIGAANAGPQASEAGMQFMQLPEGWSGREWQEAADRYGPCLIAKRNPVLQAYLEETLRKNGKIREGILEKRRTESGEKRLCSLERENAEIRRLLENMEKA